jgi:RHS repeat-associated protein
MVGREKIFSNHLYGFNKKPSDDELDCYIDYGMRMYNSKIARFISVDPLSKDFAYYSPYSFAGNKPIWAIDLDGKEEFFITDFRDVNGNLWKIEITIVSASGIATNDQTVHRSEVRQQGDGTYNVNYLYSRNGSSNGTNAFASEAERTRALGTNPTNNIPILFGLKTPINVVVSVQTPGGVVHVNATAFFTGYAPVAKPVDTSNPVYVVTYYDQNRNYIGTDGQTNPPQIILNRTTDRATYTGNDPQVKPSTQSPINAVPADPKQRNDVDNNGNKIPTPKSGIGNTPKGIRNAKPQGNSGRNVRTL